ncbi:FG-GAP-like repeat-containing protein [Paenibacillus thailandensis]|uniref:FG-GAP-like repeat-containing protein n=1 Tax=Paenibacillus thailandensis TaxID=393250 RepID=A0ABW5QSI9_9BACL
MGTKRGIFSSKRIVSAIPSLLVLSLAVLSVPAHAFAAANISFERIDNEINEQGSRLVSAEMNGDGNEDIIVAEYGTGISLMKGNGEGTFQIPVFLYDGSEQWLAEELNDDGLADLIVYSGSTIQILLQQQDDIFLPVSSYEMAGGINGITSSDLNGDGHADLAVANRSGRIVYMRGYGDGTFDLAGQTELGSGRFPLPPTIGDFNEDGNADMLVGSQAGGTSEENPHIALWTGDGDWSFAPSPPYSARSEVTALAAEDFNGDGHLDAVSGHPGSAPELWLGNGDGTFQSSPLDGSIFESGVSMLDTGDFNGDGVTDLFAVGEGSRRSFSVAYGNGDGTFQAPVHEEDTDEEIRYYAIGDYNGDGKSDVALSYADQFTISVYMARGDGRANEDIARPVWPDDHDLTVTGATYDSAELHWTPARDNVGVEAYELYQDGHLIRTVTGATASYRVTGLVPESSYSYHLVAVDAAGNHSGNSRTVRVTTLAEPAGSEP